MINKAIISEKSFSNASLSKYTFAVSKDMSKEAIKSQIEKLYSVKVISVNTFNLAGKVKRNKKGLGVRSDVKKAIVTLDKKDSIALFDIEAEKSEKGAKGAQKKEKESKISDNKDVKTVVREPKKGLIGGRTTNK